MKNARFLLLLIIMSSFSAEAQFGISYHQSSIPFVGFNYEIKDRFLPELRIGTDNFMEDLSAELVITYQFINKEDVEFYGGLGGRINTYEGLAIPIGLNVYPFEEKKFGFHIEIAPLIGEDQILRGSWGIRYRFKQD